MYKNNIHIEVSFYTYKNALRGYLFDVSMSECVCVISYACKGFHVIILIRDLDVS